MIFKHPSAIVFAYIKENGLPFDKYPTEDFNAIDAIVLNNKPLDSLDCKLLSKIFDTTEKYWSNMQEQFDNMVSITGENKPCPDVSKEIIMPLSAIHNTIKSSTPSKTYLPDDTDKSNPVIIMKEEAYLYMLSNCTEDELWDLGFLGESEEHAVKSESKLLESIKDSLLIKDMNLHPFKYATHCLKADQNHLFICSDKEDSQMLYIDGSWQPSSVWVNIMTPIITEKHLFLSESNNEYVKVPRQLVNEYKELYLSLGVDILNNKLKYYLSKDSENAIKVVKHYYNLK